MYICKSLKVRMCRGGDGVRREGERAEEGEGVWRRG